MIKKRTIWDEFEKMHNEMDRIFKDFIRRDPYWKDSNYLLPSAKKNELMDYREPIADYFETDKEIVATIEIPGVDKKDIEINNINDGIEIKVEKNEEKKDKNSYKKSSMGFYRYFKLPEYIDFDKSKATYKNGVLELKIPKKLIATKKKKLEIE